MSSEIGQKLLNFSTIDEGHWPPTVAYWTQLNLVTVLLEHCDRRTLARKMASPTRTMIIPGCAIRRSIHWLQFALRTATSA